jgi:colanic acid biosynthesis glycosyl transferase WcaI
MHLLILTHNFPPDFRGAATMQYELAKHMASAGHQVTVVTSYSHNRSEKAEPLSSDELLDGFRVLRIKSPNWKNGGFIQRFIESFIMDIGVVARGLRCSRADVVFFMSPPITLPIIASVFKLFRKSTLVLNVQDIFPELVVAMGLMERKSLAMRFGEFIERWAYSCVDYIGVHSPKNRLHIIACGVPEDKVHVLPLWVDTDWLEPRPRSNSFSESHGLNDKFVVLYAGTIGFAMGAQTIPQTASLLAGEKNIQFVIIGGGSKLDVMNDEIKKLGAHNILMLPLQPREDLPNVLASADTILVTLRKEITDNPNGYFKAVVPHKMLTNMASARPILLAAEMTSDAAALVEQSQCGKVVAAEEPVLLANAIKEMYENQQLLPGWGQNGRAFACKHFSSKIQVERLEMLFCSLVDKKIYMMNNPWDETGKPA